MKQMPPIFTVRWIDGQPYQEAPSQGGPHERASHRSPIVAVEPKPTSIDATVAGIIRDALDKVGRQQLSLDLRTPNPSSAGRPSSRSARGSASGK